uniref:FAD dependent oxidoreductase domain-containing protein n=1 Tax=Curvibacter symbiont subsp. Hydra magnipapillata TaxID=667019 RepID=C9YAW6_CURXX|nr:hypothetical protein Csp_A12670 [Curvibacter putative symbiont of Hydra magnipapillata]
MPQPERAPLRGSVEADVVVIGAGYTGLSSALHLAEAGFKVVVLEAAKVGWGASGRNGGQLVHSYSRDMDVIEARYGSTTAQVLGSMAFEGAKIIRERIDKYQIDCHFKPGGMFAAITAKQVKQLEHHKQLWERYGHQQLSLLDATEAKSHPAPGATAPLCSITVPDTCIHCAWLKAKLLHSSHWGVSCTRARRCCALSAATLPWCTPHKVR